MESWPHDAAFSVGGGGSLSRWWWVACYETCLLQTGGRWGYSVLERSMVMWNLKRLAVLTSGGDAPGMNAAIRAVVRTALGQGIETIGVIGGYAGLAAGHFRPLDSWAVSGIIQRGGTILHSARCPDFHLLENQHQAVRYLEEAGIEALIVIGGNGSQQGTLTLHRLGFPVMGIASTIDNDLAETETTIGVDTALNTAVHYIDQLKDTATSHHRAFIAQVMGRGSGYLAMTIAIATGAAVAAMPKQQIRSIESCQSRHAA